MSCDLLGENEWKPCVPEAGIFGVGKSYNFTVFCEM